MAYPYTESGYNMYDMLSMIQKSIRRGKCELAGFAAYQLKGRFRNVMWNRLFVISSEDCFGILTKELVALRKKDEEENFQNNQNISNAVALMCKALKSRDACYFACNFVLASRSPRIIKASDQEVEDLYPWIFTKENTGYDDFGFEQTSFMTPAVTKRSLMTALEYQTVYHCVCLEKALAHRDMDMIGSEMDVLRRGHREALWKTFIDYARGIDSRYDQEIIALRDADDRVNKGKKDLAKDEIFISKAAILLCYIQDPQFETVCSSGIVQADGLINWNRIRTRPISECRLADGKIPEWVYDCHTAKGKAMGKTDWDMTTTEQDALTPLRRAYFDDASWAYTYEQDFESGAATREQMEPIWEYGKTHKANPVEYIPYGEEV